MNTSYFVPMFLVSTGQQCLLKSALYNSEAFIIEISLWALMIKEGLDSDGK